MNQTAGRWPDRRVPAGDNRKAALYSWDKRVPVVIGEVGSRVEMDDAGGLGIILPIEQK